MECKYCNNKFTNSSSLNKHIKYANYCINKRGIQKEADFICKGCNKIFTSKYNLIIHTQTCVLHLEEKYKLKLEEKNKIIEKQEKHIKN